MTGVAIAAVRVTTKSTFFSVVMIRLAFCAEGVWNDSRGRPRRQHRRLPWRDTFDAWVIWRRLQPPGLTLPTELARRGTAYANPPRLPRACPKRRPPQATHEIRLETIFGWSEAQRVCRFCTGLAELQAKTPETRKRLIATSSWSTPTPLRVSRLNACAHPRASARQVQRIVRFAVAAMEQHLWLRRRRTRGRRTARGGLGPGRAACWPWPQTSAWRRRRQRSGSAAP